MIIKDEFIILPNNIVQNIKFEGKDKLSYIQLYGKRTVSYIMNLIKLQNINNDINFSVDMILWMNRLEGVKREKKYFKDFLFAMHKDNLIELNSNIDSGLGSGDFMIGKLGIYEYNTNGEFINCFKFTYSEYNTIMDNCNGKLDKYNLLNLYCNIKSRIRRNSKATSFSERELEICYPSYETIKSDISIESDKTLKQYIDALVEMNLIRFRCAGDMILSIEGSQPIRKKANFIYALYSSLWEEDLKESISLFKNRKITLGWRFLTKDEEESANNKRSVTQKTNMLEKWNTTKNKREEDEE